MIAAYIHLAPERFFSHQFVEHHSLIIADVESRKADGRGRLASHDAKKTGEEIGYWEDNM